MKKWSREEQDTCPTSRPSGTWKVEKENTAQVSVCSVSWGSCSGETVIPVLGWTGSQGQGWGGRSSGGTGLRTEWDQGPAL